MHLRRGTCRMATPAEGRSANLAAVGREWQLAAQNVID